MATDQNIATVQAAIDYRFWSKDYLKQALIAAGAEEHNYDGNRKLAQLGTIAIELLSVFIGFKANAPREKTNALRTRMTNLDRRAAIAQRIGIVDCIKYNERSGAGCPATWGKAFNAIVGAVFADSNDLITVFLMLNHVGIFTRKTTTVNPRRLSVDSMLGHTSIAKVIDTLLPCDDVVYETNAYVQESSNEDSSPRTTRVTSPPEATTVSLEDFISLDPASDLDSMRSFVILSDTADLPSSSNDQLHTPEEEIDNRDLCQSMTKISTNSSTGNISEDDTQPAQDTKHSSSTSRIRRPRSYDSAALSPQRRLRSAPADDTERPAKRSRKIDRKNNFAADSPITVYLEAEANKCRAHGLFIPQDTFFRSEIHEKVLTMPSDKLSKVATFLLCIADAHVFANLKEMLRDLRNATQQDILQFGAITSPTERFEAIETLDIRIGRLHLLQRYHILKLYQECHGPTTSNRTGHVHFTPSNIGLRVKEPGNPLFKAEAEVTKNMLKAVFPEISAASSDYQQKYDKMGQRRKMGQRFHTLCTKFGTGILGLLPDPTATRTAVSVATDTLMREMSDVVFTKFVELLDESQGELLREYSSSVAEIFDALVTSSLPSDLFLIEYQESDEILQLPKGYSDFLLLML